jgi:hypothetical protein
MRRVVTPLPARDREDSRAGQSPVEGSIVGGGRRRGQGNRPMRADRRRSEDRDVTSGFVRPSGSRERPVFGGCSAGGRHPVCGRAPPRYDDRKGGPIPPSHGLVQERPSPGRPIISPAPLRPHAAVPVLPGGETPPGSPRTGDGFRRASRRPSCTPGRSDGSGSGHASISDPR